MLLIVLVSTIITLVGKKERKKRTVNEYINDMSKWWLLIFEEIICLALAVIEVLLLVRCVTACVCVCVCVCVFCQDLKCNVSLVDDNRQEWVFTLYDFDNSGRVTKEVNIDIYTHTRTHIYRLHSETDTWHSFPSVKRMRMCSCVCVF